MFTAKDDDDRADFTRRSILFGGAQVIAFGVLGARLYELQVMQGDVYRPLADKNRLSRYALEPMRGKILDRRGVVLADTVESFRCYLTPALAGDVGKVLEALSPLIELDESALRKLADRARRSPQNLPVVVADDLGWEQAAKIGIHAPYLPGVQVEPVGRRIYNGGSTMGHIVGYVGAVERFALDDQPELRLPGIRIGKTGVERGMDNVLRGNAGAVEQEVDAHGRVVRQLSRREAVSGRNVQLTIDRMMQARVHSRLAEYRRASSAVIDTDSGEIIALASSPGYNPTGLTEGISAKKWRRMQRSSDHPMLNRA
ncbi:MAG: penicillin-binding protein 2, partial [Pseudomonadota bacterium]